MNQTLIEQLDARLKTLVVQARPKDITTCNVCGKERRLGESCDCSRISRNSKRIEHNNQTYIVRRRNI